MRVGFDGLMLNGYPSGVTVCIQELLHALDEQLPAAWTIKAYLPEGQHCGSSWQHIQPHRIKISGGRLGRIFCQQARLSQLVRNAHLDVFHSPAYILPLNIPIPKVVTVYDAIALSHPAYARAGNRLYFRFFLTLSARRADCIITLTTTMKKTLMQWLQVPEERIEIIPPGCARRFHPISREIGWLALQKRYPLVGEHFLLFVGNLEPKKNLSTLLRAFAQVQIYFPGLQLVLAGGNPWNTTQVEGLRNQLGLGSSLIQLGYVPDADLPLLYNMAQALVFPSFYEGFGLPIIEAMACGTPVLTANGGAIPEVAGEAAMIIDQPHDIQALAYALIRLLQDQTLCETLSERGRQRAADFDWLKTAKRTLACYTRVLNGHFKHSSVKV